MRRPLQERTGHQGEALPSCMSLLRVRVSFLGSGESPLPIVTIGGLLPSTFLNVVVAPVLFDRFGNRNQLRWKRAQEFAR